MSKTSRRIFKIIGVTLVILTILFFSASIVATNKIELKIREKLAQAGVTVKSVSVSLVNRSVSLDSIRFVSGLDSAVYPPVLELEKIDVSGFHILPFIKKQELIIDNVLLTDGKIAYNKRFKISKDFFGESSAPNKKINQFSIGSFSVKNFGATLFNDTLIESTAFVNELAIHDIELKLQADTSFTIGVVEADIQDFKQQKAGGLHSFAVGKVLYNSKNGKLEADSLQIIPAYNKVEFAREAKIQKTRLDITIPKIVCEGVDQQRFFTDTTVAINRIFIPEPVVHAYRNKRYPFVRDWIMPMPIEGIRRLPFKLAIDSLIISKAQIVYEEFSEKGLDATGSISFNKLDASFAALNTELRNPDKKTFATLVADCKVMNSGNLHATFKLPLNKTVNYEAFGSVRNMDLKSLNPHLGNLSRIEIADGVLNDLRFNFSYNDNVSTGEVLVNYKSLKLQALKKDKSHEVNKVLTAAINAIIKSDKDKTVDKSKRLGVIDIERDKKRFVFQFWWKSLLDGLQSTFIDNGKRKDKKKKAR